MNVSDIKLIIVCLVPNLLGDSIAYVSYDILANPYSTTFAKKKTQTDAAKIIANDITLRIGAYFHARFKKGNQ